jgi:hypothetical protein
MSWSTHYATHKHPEVEAWLAKNPRVSLHFTPTSASWLKLVEVFFSVITARPSAVAPSGASLPGSRHSPLRRRLERPLPALRVDQKR